MAREGKLFEMLVGYAAAHQHPFNVFVHLIGIPAIMLGVLIPLAWVTVDVAGIGVSLAHLLVIGFFVFYLSLDAVFAAAFLVLAIALLIAAENIAPSESRTAWTIAAALFVGGYIAQFVGHAVEKSMPVLIKHPIQANLAAPFFIVVEVLSLLGLRRELFAAVKEEIGTRRKPHDATT